jgi:hypothetical protein
MGAPELIIILLVIAFSAWGYRAGAKRTIGAVPGLLLGFLLSFIGIIIIYCFPLQQSEPFQPQAYSSPADELKKYKDLLDSGAINEYEYNIQKARILKN